MTPAERAAAANGSSHNVESADKREETARAIEQAAESGASPLAEENPPTKVIEVPEGGHVDTDGH
jgi:cell division protease FtsH